MRTGINILALALSLPFAIALSGSCAAVEQAPTTTPYQVRVPDPIRIKPEWMQIYQIFVQTMVPIKVQVSTTTKRDGCNGYSFRSIDSNGPSNDFVADFQVLHTMLGCPSAPSRRDMLLVSSPVEIQPTVNTRASSVRRTFYVPEGMELKILP